MPDPLDVQQMKAQREVDRAARQRQKDAYRREVAAREKVEREQEELKTRWGTRLWQSWDILLLINLLSL